MLISNILTARQIQLSLGITLECGLLVFPITYILSDVFSECYGYKWSRLTCYLAFAMNLLMCIVFAVANSLPAPEYWHDQQAFRIVLGTTPRILAASLIAYVVGDLVNDLIFRRMKQKHPHDERRFGLRAIVSSVFGNLVDSLIFLPLAFIGEMPATTLVVMCLTQVIVKTGYELLILPLTILTVRTVNRVEKHME